MKKNKGIKFMALLALFGIIIGIVGTGLLIIFSSAQTSNTQQELTPEKLKEIQEMINSQSGANMGTGELEE